MSCMKSSSFATAAGSVPASFLANQMGSFSPVAVSVSMNGLMPIGDYAAFNYAAMPDPITPATNTITGDQSATVGNFPVMGLYL